VLVVSQYKFVQHSIDVADRKYLPDVIVLTIELQQQKMTFVHS